MTNESRDKMKSDIKGWFLSRYEDPVQNTPYDSSEGGFLYQWGGPYDAREILFDQFGKEINQDTLEEVAEELDNISQEWERIPTFEDFDPDNLLSEYLDRFYTSHSQIKAELAKMSNHAGSGFMCSLLFAHTITCLEAYLADAFLSSIKNQRFFRAFVETDPELQKEKLPVSDIFKKMETLEGDATRRIQSIVFHNLATVQQMYKHTLGLDLPCGIKDLFVAITKRHDIVHRNCKTKQGDTFEITRAEVVTLVDCVEKFVVELDVLVEKALR